MKNIQTLTLSNKKYLFNILDSIQVEVALSANPYFLPIEDLFLMAARINKKRSFLFVSKLIGKHIPIKPQKALLTGALLAARYYEVIKGGECNGKKNLLSSFFQAEPTLTSASFIPAQENPIVIGFAETATALGHAFFDCFDHADFFHTTREVLVDEAPLISFEEEHSHATSHLCYISLEIMRSEREIILVDDELTTGKTALNFIRSIHARFPRKEYTVVSILDWRSEANKLEFVKLERSLGITIHTVSLLTGEINVIQQKIIDTRKSNKKPEQAADIEEISLPAIFPTVSYPSFTGDGSINHHPYLIATGRFGINSRAEKENQQMIKQVASRLIRKRSGKKTLILGTGEFMYIPMKIAAEMGTGIAYQSTTRSPIFVQNAKDYGVQSGLSFSNPEDPMVSHFVYNIPPGYYDELFVLFERKVNRSNLLPLLKELKQTKIKSIKIVYFSGETRCGHE